MIRKAQSHPSLFSSLDDMLNQQSPLYKLANKINWQVFEDAFIIPKKIQRNLSRKKNIAESDFLRDD